MTSSDKTTEVTTSTQTTEQVVPFFAVKANGTALTVKTSIRAGAGGRGEVLKK